MDARRNNMEWEEAFKLSTINHRAPYLTFIAWALNVEVKTIAEIGVNKAETSKIFRTLFPSAHLYLIDPWQLTAQYSTSATPISRKSKHYENAYRGVKKNSRATPTSPSYACPLSRHSATHRINLTSSSSTPTTNTPT